VLVRVVVHAGAVMDLAAGVAALDLDCCVPDRKAIAQAGLEIADHMLGVAERSVGDHDVAAEGDVL